MKNALLAIVLIMLTACGFHPRGSFVLPEQIRAMTVSIVDPNSPLGDGLRTSLRRSGVDVVDTASADNTDTAALKVLAETWALRPLSVDALVAVREYETRYTVQFEVNAADGKKLLEPQTIELSRDYVYDVNESFGNPGEQEIIQEELRRDMQAAILRRVQVALR